MCLRGIEQVAVGRPLEGYSLAASRKLMVFSIYLLERHGHLPSDEHNGVAMHVTTGRTALMLTSAELIDRYFSGLSRTSSTTSPLKWGT